MAVAFSPSGVRYADGAIQVTASPDLSSDGFLPFDQSRSWSNSPNTGSNVVGSGWVISQLPYLEAQNINGWS